MSLHGICTHGEVIKTQGENEAQVIVHGSQMIHYCSLILALLPAPRAEGQATPPLEDLG